MMLSGWTDDHVFPTFSNTMSSSRQSNYIHYF